MSIQCARDMFMVELKILRKHSRVFHLCNSRGTGSMLVLYNEYQDQLYIWPVLHKYRPLVRKLPKVLIAYFDFDMLLGCHISHMEN